jgi:dTDP-4-dehydrorhamnose 3,5-epimerase
MEIIQAEIPGLLIIKPDIHTDDRGYFLESYNKKTLARLGFEADFMQDNESFSRKGVLRGLHFQIPPYEQGKLVRVVSGAALDVAVDLRKNSVFFGKWISITLTSENKLMFWMPPGFAHGFLSLQDNTLFSYKCTNAYNREAEKSLRWDDPDLIIDWGISKPVITPKDANAGFFRDFISPF